MKIVFFLQKLNEANSFNEKQNEVIYPYIKVTGCLLFYVYVCLSLCTEGSRKLLNRFVSFRVKVLGRFITIFEGVCHQLPMKISSEKLDLRKFSSNFLFKN